MSSTHRPIAKTLVDYMKLCLQVNREGKLL